MKKPADSKKELRTEKIMVILTKSEREAIAKKAIALHIKESQAIRMLALKAIGAIQLNLFS